MPKMHTVRQFACAGFQKIQLSVPGGENSLKVLEKCQKNLIGHSRLAFNNHESNINC